MSNTVIGASVEIEYKSVGNVRKALKEAKADLLAMSEQFGATSQEAIKAARRVADLKDQIEDAKETADLFDPGKKFQAFVTLGSQIASGFAAVQGAMALVGTESEALQKQLLKVQGAMALAKGLSDLKDFGKSIQQVKIFISAATNQLSSFQKAMISTGIGALVVASGLLVAYWDDIKGFVTGYNKELEDTNKKLEKQNELLKYEIKVIEASRDTKLEQGKTEEEITNEILKRAIIIAENDAKTLKNLTDLKEEHIAITKRNYEFVQGLTQFVLGIQRSIINIVIKPLDLAFKGVNNIRKMLGQEEVPDYIDKINQSAQKVDESISSWAGKKLFDVEDVDKNIKEANLKLVESENNVSQLRKKLSDAQSARQKKVADEQKKIDDERKKRIEEAIKAEQKASEDLAKSRMSDRNKELFEIEKTYNEQKKIIEDGGKSSASLTELYAKQRADIEKKYKDEQLKAEKDFQDIVNELTSRLQNQNLSDEDAARKAITDKYAKEREELMKQHPNNLALLVLLKQNEQAELAKVETEFQQRRLQEESARLLTEAGEETASFESRLKLIQERKDLENQIIFKSDKERNDFIKQNEEATTKLLSDQYNARVQLARAVGDSLSALSDIVGRETAAGKALAIAQATINTFLGITEVWKSKSVLPEPFNTASKIAATITTAAGGFAAVRNIAKTKVPGGGGGGGLMPAAPAPLAPVLSPVVQGQAINTEAINNLGNQATRAYVLNSDIQNNDQRNAYLERNARIG